MLALLLGLLLTPALAVHPQDQVKVAAPENFIDLFNGAHASLDAGRLSEAEASLKSALRLRPQNANCGYAMACVSARAGDLEHAALWLSLASSWGYDDPAVAAWDPDLEALRKTSGWRVLLGSIEARLRTRPQPASKLLFDWGFGSYLSELSPDKTRLLVGRGGRGYLYGLAEEEVLSVLSRHGEDTDSAHFTPDGRYIVRATSEYKYEVWNGRTGEFVRGLDGPGFWGAHILCSSDGRLAVGFGEGPPSESGVKVWDLQTGKLIRSIPIADPDTVALSPDATRALVVEDPTRGPTCVGLWDLEHGVKLASRVDGGRPRFDVSFSSDGALAFAMSEERGRVVVYDGWTGSVIRTIDDEGNGVRFPHFVSGEHTLAFETKSGELRWIDLIDGAMKRALKVHDRPWGMTSVDPSEQSMLISHSRDPRDGSYRVEMLDANSGARLWARDLPDHVGWMRDSSFSADGSQVLFRNNGSQIEISETRTGRTVQMLNSPVLGLDVQAGSDPESALLATTGGTLRRIALSTGRVLASTPAGEPGVRSLIASPNGERLLVIRAGGRTSVLVSESLSTICDLVTEKKLTKAWGFSARFSRDGEHLAIRYADDCFGIWSALSGKPEFQFKLENASISDLDWSHDGRLLAAADGKGSVQLFEARTGAAFGPRIKFPAAVSLVRFSPVNERFVVGGGNPVALVFEPGSEKPLFELSHQLENFFGELEVGEAVFTPDGTCVVTTTLSEGDVIAWDAKDGHRLWKASCGGGNLVPLYASFDRAGTRLCNYGQTIQSPRVIDAQTGATLLDFSEREYNWLDFSADGERLLASKGDSLQVLQATDGAMLYERVEMASGKALVRTASMHVEGPPAALRRVHVLFGDASYPLDGFAAVLLDPKRVRAAAAGVKVVPALLPEPPTIERETPRAGTAGHQLVATGSCAAGMLGFEVELDGQPLDAERVRAATKLEDHDRRARLDLSLEPPSPGSELRVRVCAIGRSGLASRPAFAHLQGAGR